MRNKFPDYIHPRTLEWDGIEPPKLNNENAVLGLYYNVLCPQEREADLRKRFYAWISAMDPSLPFPLDSEELFLCSPSTCKGIANKAFYGQLAKKLYSYLDFGLPFENAVQESIVVLQKEFCPIYIQIGNFFKACEENEKMPSLKARYAFLASSFDLCGKDPQGALSYAIQKYMIVKDDPKKLKALLLGSMEKGSGQELRDRDCWNHRKRPLIEMIDGTLSFYSNIPFFIALQEVTPDSLEDFKHAFANVHWVSFNNISREKTRVLKSEDEAIFGGAGSHTATIGLSPELHVKRVELGDLPNCSGTTRTILGIEVINQKTGGSFAIFSTHADHVIQDDIYARTNKAIQAFIQQFTATAEGHLPFIMGGDLNAFEGMGGDDYLKNLRSQYPLTAAIDFREGKFYSPKEIMNATFIGHHRDDYKMFIDQEGNVEPNALDHILLTMEKMFGFRKGGVYDESGKVIDAARQSTDFKNNIQKRNTTSDHFMNGVVFFSP